MSKCLYKLKYKQLFANVSHVVDLGTENYRICVIYDVLRLIYILLCERNLNKLKIQSESHALNR